MDMNEYNADQRESAMKVVKNNQDKTTGLYKIAAKIFKKVKTGSGYKTQLYQAQYPNKLLLNAVLMNVFKWEKVIDVLVDKSNILEKEINMDPELVYVLITELMWSKFGLKGNAKNILAIKKYKNDFIRLMKENELEQLSNSVLPKVWKPRYFRINTLFITVEDALKRLSELKFNKLESPKSYVEFLKLIKSDKFEGNTFVQDIHIKELLVFNSKMKFYKLELYNNGSLIVQDKASCLASYLLNPEPESTVLDMCAAPGMKTSHLAAIMNSKGKLYAVDHCKDRFILLQKMLEKYGVKNAEIFNIDAMDFPYYDDVKYILIDPSCSGSGIVDRVRKDFTGSKENFKLRLKKLANLHSQLLNHALKSYPNLERLVYSTCSANPEENEAVVDEVLSINGKFKLLDCTKIVKGWMNKGTPGFDCTEKCLNAVPNIDCTNGFFIAVFVRRDFEEKEVIDDDEVSEVEPCMEVDESTVKMKKNENASAKKRTNLKISKVARSKRLKVEIGGGVSQTEKKNGSAKISISNKKNANIKVDNKLKIKINEHVSQTEKNHENVDNKLKIKTDDSVSKFEKNNKFSPVKKSKNLKKKANLKGVNILKIKIDGGVSEIKKNNKHAFATKNENPEKEANLKDINNLKVKIDGSVPNIGKNNKSASIKKRKKSCFKAANKLKIEINSGLPQGKNNEIDNESNKKIKKKKQNSVTEANESNSKTINKSSEINKTHTAPVIRSQNSKRRAKRIKSQKNKEFAKNMKKK